MFEYEIHGMKIKTNLILCNKKQELLYNFYKKCDKCNRSITLSQYYANVLEVIKFIERHFLYETNYIKNQIQIKINNNNEPEITLQELIQNNTLFVFEIDDDDYEFDLTQEQIDNYVNILETRTSHILQHQDIIECFN